MEKLKNSGKRKRRFFLARDSLETGPGVVMLGSSMAVIRSFIFDIGNVLIPFDFTRALRRISPQCAVPITAFPEEARALVGCYESGRVSRAEFLRETIALLQFRGAEAEFVAAWEDIFDENEAMTKLVERLRAHYPLYLLSNTSDIHVNYFESKYPVFGHFSDAVYSHLVRCSKPDREIFEKAIRQFGVKPEETVYIDDLAANVAGAAAVGFHAIEYDHARHSDLLAKLAALGVLGLTD